MSEKRRDSQGRILNTGEIQRPNGSYEYRYKDINGKRRSEYAPTLQDLRKREKEITVQLAMGISFFEGSTPLSGLTENLFAMKSKWRESTRTTMERYLSIIKKSRLYNMPANRIKMLDCKMYMVELHEQGYSYGTIASVHTILKESFAIACENDALVKNPCSFMLKSIIEDDTEDVKALTEEQETSLFQFLRTDTYGLRYLDMFTILLGTGLRISEFAALTIKDIDLSDNVIHVNKQISRLVGTVKITPPKSKSGFRDIPMTPEVRASVLNLLEKRKHIKRDV